MNTARRAALLVGRIIALVGLLVAAVAPVSADGYRCGSALLATDKDEYLAPDPEYSLGPGDYYPPTIELAQLSQAIGERCDAARRSRLTLTGVGVLAGCAAMAAGGAFFRDGHSGRAVGRP